MFHHAELSTSPFLPSLSLSSSWKALSSLAIPMLGLAGSPMRDSRYFPIEIKGLLPQTAVVPITVLNKTKPMSGNRPSGMGRPSGVAAQALLPLLPHLGHTAPLWSFTVTVPHTSWQLCTAGPGSAPSSLPNRHSLPRPPSTLVWGHAPLFFSSWPSTLNLSGLLALSFPPEAEAPRMWEQGPRPEAGVCTAGTDSAATG